MHNQEMLTALKFYKQRVSDLTCTVPEAKTCNLTASLCTVDEVSPSQWSKKKEKSMYNNITLNPTEKFDPIEAAQDHLIDRLSAATEKKIQAARKSAGLVNDDRPRTPQGFVDRITSGKFYIPEDRKNAFAYDPTDYIEWRDPAIKRDEASFNTARETINQASDDVMDILIVKGAEAGLAAINEFKGAIIH
jgi:hypothetical protein